MKNRALLALILAAAALFAVAVLTSANQPLEELPPTLVRPVSWVAGVTFVAFVAAWKWSRRSFWRWEFPVALITAGVSAATVAWVFLLFFNVLLDASPPQARVMQIVNKEIRKSRKGWSASYQVSARDLGDAQTAMSMCSARFSSENPAATASPSPRAPEAWVLSESSELSSAS